MTFDAERIALELIAALRDPLERLERRNRAHADQARRAAASIAHNLSLTGSCAPAGMSATR
jgi:hypothetical protein